MNCWQEMRYHKEHWWVHLLGLRTCATYIEGQWLFQLRLSWQWTLTRLFLRPTIQWNWCSVDKEGWIPSEIFWSSDWQHERRQRKLWSVAMPFELHDRLLWILWCFFKIVRVWKSPWTTVECVRRSLPSKETNSISINQLKPLLTITTVPIKTDKPSKEAQKDAREAPPRQSKIS